MRAWLATPAEAGGGAGGAGDRQERDLPGSPARRPSETAVPGPDSREAEPSGLLEVSETELRPLYTFSVHYVSTARCHVPTLMTDYLAFNTSFSLKPGYSCKRAADRVRPYISWVPHLT